MMRSKVTIKRFVKDTGVAQELTYTAYTSYLREQAETYDKWNLSFQFHRPNFHRSHTKLSWTTCIFTLDNDKLFELSVFIFLR